MTSDKTSKMIIDQSVMRISILALTIFIHLNISPVMHAQAPRVGINTASPLAALHVVDSSVLFSSSTFFSTSAYPPVQGMGSRTMWFGPRRAFRTGHVLSNRWDRDSIGLYSIAANYNTLADGQYSASFGSNTSALGSASTATGEFSKASGLASFAMGSYTIASGDYSLSMGHETVASGNAAVAMGYWSRAEGSYSLATGFQTLATGQNSSSFGGGTEASGKNATAFGNIVVANSLNMFAIGYRNDTTSHDKLNWVPTDPLFVVGNGDENQRRNALTLLKNGNLGLQTVNPTFRLHVTNDNAEAGGMLEGIMIENTHEATGEAGLSFRNKSIPSAKQWTIGLNQNPRLAFCYGTDFTGPQTKMVLDTFGRLGVNSTSPATQLHVIRNGPSGGPFNADAIAIFESNTDAYIQLSNENTAESGILSGNEDTYIRSGIIFRADSSVQFRTSGNNTRMVVTKNGHVGIGTTNPVANLDVNGTSKFGASGSTINEIIKATVNVDISSVPPNGGTGLTYWNVPNGGSTSAVSVSPGSALPAGLVIASARVFNSTTVEVRFVNTTATAIDPAEMNYHVLVIR